MWGIIPAAGRGTRIQPLAFSKELLPVGSRLSNGTERPCAVSEYLVDRMIIGGARKICFVIAPGKSDIMEYFGASYRDIPIAYVVQQGPFGLCDAIFAPQPFIDPAGLVAVGLPDTIWFPAAALGELPKDRLAFLLFPVARPERFDAVVMAQDGALREIQVKQRNPASKWIWGAFTMPGQVFNDLHALWIARERRDEYVGTLVNAYIASGGTAVGVKAGRAYVDVGTIDGYRAAIRLLSESNLVDTSLSSLG